MYQKSGITKKLEKGNSCLLSIGDSFSLTEDKFVFILERNFNSKALPSVDIRDLIKLSLEDKRKVREGLLFNILNGVELLQGINLWHKGSCFDNGKPSLPSEKSDNLLNHPNIQPKDLSIIQSPNQMPSLDHKESDEEPAIKQFWVKRKRDQEEGVFMNTRKAQKITNLDEKPLNNEEIVKEQEKSN